MSIPYAINGLGRIGRALVRAARQHPRLRCVAVNDLVPAPVLARLLARDSVHGRFPGEIGHEPDALLVDGRRVPVSAAASPVDIPWPEEDNLLVVEATGAVTVAAARGHLRNDAARSRDARSGRAPSRQAHGAERVVLAWNPDAADLPAVDAVLCLGINEGSFDPARHRVISNSSCTTNCIAPIVAVLHRAFGIRHGMVNTVHGYTPNQMLLDGAHGKGGQGEPRRSRAAPLNLIPVASRAAEAVGWVLPQLAGRLDGFGVRVPVADVALLDLVLELERPASVEAAADQLRSAAAEELAGILRVTDEELVSTDFLGETASAVVDLPLLQSLDGGHMLRVVAWYDNEWGYANRLAELLLRLAAPGDER